MVLWRRFVGNDEIQTPGADVLSAVPQHEEWLAIYDFPRRLPTRTVMLNRPGQTPGYSLELPLPSARDGRPDAEQPHLPSPTESLVVSTDADSRRALVRPPGEGFVLWDLRGGAPPTTLVASVKTESVHILPDGTRALACGDSAISLLALRDMQAAWTIDAGASISAVAVAPDGAHVAFATSSGRIEIVEAATGVARPLHWRAGPEDFAEFDRHGHAMFIGTASGTFMKSVE